MDTVDLDVENLFNDGQLDQIITDEQALSTSSLPVPGLAEQFFTLQFCGGINRVSWSRQGHIALVSEDGSVVSVRCLRVSTENREWKLSAPRRLEATFENVVNLTWSPSGFDLAIIDSLGRIAIYSMTTICLNRLNESKSASTDSPDELGMPVGCWWLNQDRQDRPRPVISSATRGGDRWTHNMTKARALGPLYPRAFCMVNRKGILSMTYQRPGARYTKTSVNLPLKSDTICSHVAFSPTTEGKILLAVSSVDGNLSVYHIQVTWPSDLMTDPTSTTQPNLNVELIATCVSMWSDLDVADPQLIQDYKPDDWVMTHLNIIPTSDIESANHQPPCIWAAYTLTNPAVNATDSGFLLNSIIRRWSIAPFKEHLHSRFDDIPTKTETSSVDDYTFVVERLPDLLFAEAITSIELIDAGHMVAVSTVGGNTEFWSPITSTLVSYEGETQEVTSLAQSGFAFNLPPTTVINILSPNACSILGMAEDLKPSITYARDSLQSTTQDLDLEDPTKSASIAAVTLAFARSCLSNTHGDDVLACVLSNYASNHYIDVVYEMYRNLFRDTEFIHEKAPGSEVERLVSKPIVIKVLSFSMGLLKGSALSLNAADERTQHATLASLWTWLAINFRYIATVFILFYREHGQSPQPPQKPNQPAPPPISPSFVDAICNTIHWVLDFFRFMISTILEIGDRRTNPDFFTSPTFATNLGDAVGDGSQGLVALILNSQWSRSFLAAIARAMRAFIEAHERGHSPQIARIVHTIRRYSVRKGMNISAIDKLLDSRWYVRNGLREGEQMDNATIAKRQMTMYSTGKVGPEYANSLRTLLDKVINDPESGLRATGDIERLKLWTNTPDLNWLLLGFNSQFSTATMTMTPFALSKGSTTSSTPLKLYDVHRKSMILVTGVPDQPIRRCVRCGSVSGDIEGPDKSWGKNMSGYLARCVCDAYWILEGINGEDRG